MSRPDRPRVRRLIGLALLCAGCASEPLQPDYGETRALIADATGSAEIYDPDTDLLSADQIQAELEGGLTLDESLRLALLNSRRLQAGFASIGVARADYVQAGLLENPQLGLGVLFPTSGKPRLLADLSQGIMDIWRIPDRQRVASARVDQQVLEVARLAGELAARTKTAYYESVAARELARAADAARQLAERVAASVDLAASSGVATRTVIDRAATDTLRAELAASQAQQQAARSTRELASLLSLSIDLHDVPFVDPLPPPMDPGADPTARERWVSKGRQTRLDLVALARAVAEAEAQLDLARAEARPDVDAGVSYERLEAGGNPDHVVGPTLSLELPIFDDGEAGISRARYELERLRKTYEALDAEVAQEIRAAVDRAALAASAARLVDEQLGPQLRRSSELAHRAYEQGDLTLGPVLAAEATLLRGRPAVWRGSRGRPPNGKAWHEAARS